MTPGPMDFRGPIMRPVGFKGPSRGLMGFRGPIEMTLRNQYVEDQSSFFLFWRSHHNPDKTVAFFREDFFFWGGRSHQIQTKPWHIPCPFWSLQNWRCVIFELTPGPRLALDAPVCLCHVKRVNPFQIAMKIFFSVCTEWVFNFRIWTFAKTSWVPLRVLGLKD